ncbi:MAG TPA: hypothetical protein PK710_15315, partial [Polyangiaceae bacterium]|nr:hypothetical protein [Polyangiaceae bacterium]
IERRLSTRFLAPFNCPKERIMFLMLSKKSRRTNRNRTARFKAKLAAKNRRRRAKIYQLT